MDERHWWIAGKIQESFHIGGYDNPTLLEDFMCQPESLDMINQFFNPGGPCRLFFYCENPELGSLSSRELHITGSLATMKGVDLESVTILYFLRKDCAAEIEASRMEKDIYCGELKGNTIETLSNLISDIYLPLMKSQKDWGQCTEENQHLLMHNMDKVLSSLQDSGAASQSSKHVMLKHAENLVGQDFKQHRLAASDQQIISEYETLVSDWMSTIEGILHDTSDERFLDPNAGPLSELERWKRRLRLLTSITEQLKGKECKAVMGVLITAKSRLLKKWKLIDSCITDAINETKDKVRYLESLKRHLDQLYYGATPATITGSAIPGIIHTIKQMDSISRFYARQGFLGLLFTKITNQIVLACKEYIQQGALGAEGEDQLWTRVQQELLNKDGAGGAHSIETTAHRHLQAQIDTKLKTHQKSPTKKTPSRKETSQESLFSRLRSCMTIQNFYRDSLRALRDSLGASHNLSHFTSLSSLAPPTGGSGNKAKAPGVSGSGGGAKTARGSLSTSPSKKTASSGAGDDGHGVSVADEQTIMAHMDSFCSRIRQILDVIHTLTQFNKMVMNTGGLPRPRREDLVAESVVDAPTPSPEPPVVPPTLPGPQDSNLDAIAEDEEEAASSAAEVAGDDKAAGGADGRADEAYDVVSAHSGLTKQHLALLKRYYPDDAQDEGPSITTILTGHVRQLTSIMEDNITTKTMLDVESKDKERFDEVYTSFLVTVADLERFLAAYLHALFVRKLKTQEALTLVSLFSSIQQRSGIRMVISEKFIDIFNWYESDLENIQKVYEKHKDEPPIIRNAPPVAGAIHWSRQLLKFIEEPMKIFRENKAVSSLKDFGRIVKIYNRLATALVTFESLWFTHWKQTIEHAKNGLKATLFVIHPETQQIVINADEKVLQLIHEARWLTRLGIQIPESAAAILQQEDRFKNYKDHLSLCLREFSAVRDQIPDALGGLFEIHIELALQNFQPGLTTLAWSSLNIDAFLHQIHTGTARLRYLVERVRGIMETKVEGNINKISNMVFFDYNMAFEKTWPPETFISAMEESIRLKSQELQSYINTVEAGIKEAATILASKKSVSSLEAVSRNTTALDQAGARPSSKAEDRIIHHLLVKGPNSYHDRIYAAVLLASTRTLVTLAESSGCRGEAVAAASALSDPPSSIKDGESPLRGIPSSLPPSRAQSAAGRGAAERAVSVLSMLSDMTWSTEKAKDVTYLQFEVSVKFSIPNIVLEPPLVSIQNAVDHVARTIMDVPKGVRWCGSDGLGREFTAMIQEDSVVDEILGQINGVLEDLQGTVRQHLHHFSLYDFLWKDDMYGAYYEFIEHDPGSATIHKEVTRLLGVEQKVKAIPDTLPVGPVCLSTAPIRDALHGFAMAWKTQYASLLHEEAKKKLDAAVLYRTDVRERLELDVVNLNQLNSTLQLLEELVDMENKIDDIYLPIETMYSKLREFELRLPRVEVESVEGLRDAWVELLALAEEVRVVLLKDRRSNFEQELDKQVKTFTVEVIQFRNAFDAQGPAVPGIPPAEAVHRLQDFQQRYALYDEKRTTLDSVSKLFGIACKPFPELDKTGEELELLGMLYGLFQKFIRFDDTFRDTLWSEVELETATREVESYWDEGLSLPSKLKDWDAYNDMKNSIQQYRDVFPLLHKLNSKEIRNRHWLQVMAVTGSNFQLEANVFKLCHLLDIGLIKHKSEIEEICQSASRELELEVKLRMTEEEWTEQVLNFEHYKRRGPMYLDKLSTSRLLEQLEDAQALLATMLTSRYIGPLREEAASWAEKLKEVGEVLELWLEVQDLWNYLEAVFSNSATAKELPQEAKRFARIDKQWTKMMKRAYDTRNVLQCCYGEEVPKAVVLRHISQELEICFKSLMGYLDKKRRAFPRFFFVSDTTLLAILSRPHELDSVKPHLRSLFSAIHDIKIQKYTLHDSQSDLTGDHMTPDGKRIGHDKGRSSSNMSPHHGNTTPANLRIDKRLTQVQAKGDKDSSTDIGRQTPIRGRSRQLSRAGQVWHKILLNVNPSIAQYVSTVLPSEMTTEEAVTMEATAVTSVEGETLQLDDKVLLTDGVEVWLDNLRSSVTKTLLRLVLEMVQDVEGGMPTEELAHKYPAQVCRLGVLYYWTRDCEQGVNDLRYDRKALHGTSKRFGAAMSKLQPMLLRSTFRTVDEPILPMHRARIENMITLSLFLRDIIDNMCNRKIREPTDFDWRRNLRFYIHNIDEQPTPSLYLLDDRHTYGCEFYGATPSVGQTLATDRCYLAMSQAAAAQRGSLVTAGTGAGKTDTVRGFGQSLGKFVMMYQCGADTDPASLSKVLQGLAMDGSWGCFDDLQTLPPEGLCVLVDHIQAVFGALRARQHYCIVGDGQEVPIKPGVNILTTYNPDHRPVSSLPPELRAQFRQVTLSTPELSLVIKAKCSALGLKSPSVLALRLKLVTELAHDQLPEQLHYHFSSPALTGVLTRAAARRRVAREGDRSQDRASTTLERTHTNLERTHTTLERANTSDRMEKKASEDYNNQSRTNSALSTAASNLQLQHQSSSAMMAISQTAKSGTAPTKKGGTPNPLSAVAKMEHAVVGQALMDVIGPRLTQEHLPVFKQIVKDVFSGLPDPPAAPQAMSAVSRGRSGPVDLEGALDRTAGDYGLVAHKAWRDKCQQLYNISQVHQGIIVAGPPGSGKSSIIQCLVEALCSAPRGVSRASTRGATRGATTASDMGEVNHKLQRVFPLVVDDLDSVFGCLQSPSGDWVDGIFTSAWKKASRNQSTTWLCLDGPLHAGWADRFTSVLDSSKALTLANGDQLVLSSNMKLLFETDDLTQASPSIVARSGILFVDKTVVGWRPIAKAWLENRTQQEVHVLQRAFEKTLDPISQYVITECKPKIQVSEVGLFRTCLNLLSAMLADNIELGGELHIERLFLFCLMWTFGGLLEDKERLGFNDLLATLSSALPDDDRDICFYDYYVDEAGEWDPWQARVPESAPYTEHGDLLGSTFVDTVDTIRVRLLVEFACASGQNVLLLGAPGSGKTAMINDFLDAQDQQLKVTKRLVYSGTSQARQLQQFVEANIYHRQGFVYGAKENKKLQIFIDDLNLPKPDELGVQRCNELLRRLVDDRVLCTQQKPFEWRTVEDLTVLSAMSISDCPSVCDQELASRLMRHFAIFNLPTPTDDALKAMVHGTLECNMLSGDLQGLDIDLHNSLVSASCKLLTAVKRVLRPSQMPGRTHYMFTLKDIVTCFQCLKRLVDESRAEPQIVVSLWKHEMDRIMRDRICRSADMMWFDETIDGIIKEDETWAEFGDDLNKHFVTFPVDSRVYNRPVTSLSKKEVRVQLQPVKHLKDVHHCLQTHLNRYNDEFGNVYLDIMLSENIVSHLIKMHRVISYHNSGNFLLVGPVGSHLSTLVRLALHVADLPIHHLDSSKQNTFFDGLRSAVRLTGSEGKVLTLFFTGRDLEDGQYLDAINSLLVSGEYPHLFTNDEMDGLLQALVPVMKREHTTMDPTKFFVSRVKINLHVILCLPPGHRLMRASLREYPGLLSGCQVIWMCDWTKESLLGEAQYFLNKHSLTKDCEADLSDGVSHVLANIHSYVLHDCRQTTFTGDTASEVTMTQFKVNDRKGQLKAVNVTLPNRPYSKALMLENIKLKHSRADIPSSSELFVGPTTYKRFLDTFRRIYTLKATERTEKVHRLKKAVTTLDETRQDASSMRESIKKVHKDFEEARSRAQKLLNQLTAKATVLEKLKARNGMATALGAFLKMNELSDDEEEEDNLLTEFERDKYDDEFDKMREAKLKTRHKQAKDELIEAQKSVEDWRGKLAASKKQVIVWKHKVDRSCIDRLKNFQNPPLLVGQVMEMVMTLIGKRLPSQRIETKDSYPSHEGQSGKFSASSESTKYTSTSKKNPDILFGLSPPSSFSDRKGTIFLESGKTFHHDPVKSQQPEKFSRAAWKEMQLTMADVTKFVDMLHNVPWEDGLPNDVVAAVESYLAKGKDGELGVTGEGTMLENANEKEKGFVAQKQRSLSPDSQQGITIKSAKYSSEDAATLVYYTIAIVEFTRNCGPLKASLERVQELQREIEENDRLQRQREQEIARRKQKSEENAEASDKPPSDPSEEEDEDLTVEDLPRIQGLVNDLQEQFNAAVEEKHSLESELSSMRERLKASTDMKDSLKEQESSWRQLVVEDCNNDMLVSNAVAAAAFLTYCSGMNTDIRRRMSEFYLTICEHHSLPLPSKKLFHNLQLIDYLYPPITVHQMSKLALPRTPLMLENAALLLQGDNLMAWPLISDAGSRVIDWLQCHHRDKGLVTVRYSEIRSQFDNCLSDGCPLLITDVDPVEFMRDPRFSRVIHLRQNFTAGRAPFKMAVGDHEVECQPHFRMFLHTTAPPHVIPAELSAYVSLVLLQQTRKDVEEELLERFMEREKARLNEERSTLLQERLDNMSHLSTLEDQMVSCLSGDTRMLNDLPTIKRLADLKKHYDETQESQARVENGEAAIDRAKESFRIIAKRGAVCYDTAQFLHEINPLYQVAFSQFLDLFDAATSHSDRAAVKAVVDRLVHNSFTTTYRSLAERDRHLYALMLAIEIEDSEGRVGPGEREFLITPTLGSVTMTALGRNQPPDSKIPTTKKPFDWMTDDQYNNLQILAIHYDWFQDMFERMPKDGRETQWRTLCESESPETQHLPDKMDDTFTHMQRLCVVRAVRSDRLMNLTQLFIHNVLGKKFYGEVSPDLPLALRQSSATTPVLVLHQDEHHMARRLITDYAGRKQQALSTVALCGAGASEERRARKAVQKAMAEGTWLVLENGHTSLSLLSGLETFLAEQTTADPADPQFRVWITARATLQIPTRVLQTCVKVMVDSARTVKSCSTRAFSQLEPDALKQCPRPEWPAVLHNLCYLHGALKLRARFGRGGWNQPGTMGMIGTAELTAAIAIATEEFKDTIPTLAVDGSPLTRTTSWPGLRYTLAETIYGNFTSDPRDLTSMAAMIDYFISPNAVKKEFEFTKIKYKHPAAFFSPHPRLSQLSQALENVPTYLLECPEACNLHPSSETLLGDEQYIFTRLNKVYDSMPSSNSLSHQLFPRPPTPFDGPPQANISTSSNNPQVVDQGMFASASFATLKLKKEVELWEVCHTMLPRVPKAYSKDYVTERIKKIGGYTSFNLFLMKELDMMFRLLTEVKATLQAIKSACEVDSMGDALSPLMLAAADDLYHLRIPHHWCQLAGNTAPPPNQALGTWLTDLTNRCQHFERILVQGREKMPAYWLGAFFYPRGLLALLKQDCYRHHPSDRSGTVEQYVFQTEITARDKDHIRDPPAEGMFVFGIYLWGCAWEKANAELVDQPPRHACAALPVVHLTCWPQGDKPALQDPARAAEVYPCPVYQSRITANKQPIMELDLSHIGVPAQRWALRGLAATVRPY